MAHAHRLSPIELRYAAQALGLLREGEPTVTKYPGERYKLSTDPADMPPYPRPMTWAESEAEIEEGLAQIERGEEVPFGETLAKLRERIEWATR